MTDAGAAPGASSQLGGPEEEITMPPRVTSRTRRLASGIATSIASRGVAAVSPLLLVPLTLHYLGQDLYGLWAAILALTSMALWADLGLGNGLLTKLSPVLARSGHREARKLIATAYLSLSAIAVAGLAALFLLTWVLPWSQLLGVSDPVTVSRAPVMAVITIGAFVLNVPLSLIQRVQYANQQVSRSNMWQAAGSLTAVCLAWLAVALDAGPYVVIAGVAFGPVIANVANTVRFSFAHRELVPRAGDAELSVARSMFALGGQFFVVSVVSSIALNVDNLVIARTLGLSAVTEYTIPYRAMTALGLLVTLINLPLWPANSEALVQGDVAWVRRTTRRITFASALAVAGPGLVLTLLAGPIFAAWLGSGHPTPSRLLLFILTLWWVCTAGAAPRFMVQNSVGLVRPQMFGWLAYLVASVVLKFPAASLFGLEGVVGVSLATYLLVMWPAAQVGYRSALHATEARHEKE